MRPQDSSVLEPNPPPGTDLLTWLKRLDRRDWWLWWLALGVIVLLTLGLISFVVPELVSGLVPHTEFKFADLVKGLTALVLLFNLYTIYQLQVIKRLRNGFVEQYLRAEKFRQLALFDSLTGAYNRRVAEERLAQEVDRCRRKGLDLTIALLDLNSFKQINDSYGHQAGDIALKAFAERLQRASRGSDTVARMGGDEFILLLPECKTGQLEIVLSRLRNTDFEFQGRRIPLAFSVGRAVHERSQSPEELLQVADQALYQCKRGSPESYTHVS